MVIIYIVVFLFIVVFFATQPSSGQMPLKAPFNQFYLMGYPSYSGTSIAYTVNALPYPPNLYSLGVEYLVNGFSNTNCWYQVGLIYDPYLKGATNGYSEAYEAWCKGESIIPESGNTGIEPFSGVVNDGDKIDISLQIVPGARGVLHGMTVVIPPKVLAVAYDENTHAAASVPLPAYGSTSFVGTGFGPNSYGQWTGPLTEWHGSQSNCDNLNTQAFIPIASSGAYTGQAVWVGLEEFASYQNSKNVINCTYAAIVYKYDKFTPSLVTPNPSYTLKLASDPTSPGEEYYSNGNFITGVNPTGKLGSNLYAVVFSPAVLNPDGTIGGGTIAYVDSQGSDSVSEISVATGTVFGTISLNGQKPYGMAKVLTGALCMLQLAAPQALL